MKKSVLAGFLAFLVFMAACTVIAKGIYKAGLARVSVCQPEKMSITHRINAVGRIVPGQEYGIYAAENLRVHTVLVQAGERVAAGDTLFCVDMQDLEEQLQSAQAQADYLQTQIQDLEGSRKEQNKEQEIAAARLLADYDLLVQKHDLLIGDCELAADSAKLRLKNAQAQEGTAGSHAGADSLSADALEIKLLKKEYEKAKNEVERARLQKEEALREWNRSLEDAKRQAFTGAAQTVKLQGDLAAARTRLEKLKALREKEGRVCAAEDGMILGSLLSIGERTTDRACMLYMTLDGSSKIEVPLGESDAARLSIGDSVSLQYKTVMGEKKKESGVMSYIEQDEEQGGGQKLLRIEPESESAQLLPGQTVNMEAVSKSDSYGTVIPKSALFKDEGNGYYVYVVEPYEGILGKEDRVHKIPVTVLEQNENSAAVSAAALGEESAVVKGSNKELKEDDAVRVLEG